MYHFLKAPSRQTLLVAGSRQDVDILCAIKNYGHTDSSALHYTVMPCDAGTTLRESNFASEALIAADFIAECAQRDLGEMFADADLDSPLARAISARRVND